MRKKLFLGTNTKMHKTITETKAYLQELGEGTKEIDRMKVELFVIPSYTALESASSVARENGIRLGAQNMCWEDRGQFTGEISPLMLQEVGVEIVEIGHSERRHILRETDLEENMKVLAALRHGFTPLLCIGETKEQKEYGVSREILSLQLKIGLYGVSREKADKLLIAYEPVWAIGVNGKPASPEYAEAMHMGIRETLTELFGYETGANIPILYGGSVNNDNAAELCKLPHIDGLFIGRSAWDARNFCKIIHEVIATAAAHSCVSHGHLSSQR